jgi:MoxR-like ATPase
MTDTAPTIRQPAEERHALELATLRHNDPHPRPPGWNLSPKRVETFLLGSGKETFPSPDGQRVAIRPKYLGDRRLIQVAIATLASERALLLVGEPGTAKSWVSEHLAAAISGTSRLVIQGTAGTTEDQVKYAWNYALLLAEGPSERALVASPLLRAMREGYIARFEEMTRCASEVQDTLLSVLSEKEIAIPELGQVTPARRGFNLIATANTRDRGINDMSSALKRRFNFVTLPVVDSLEQEMAIVETRTRELMADYQVQAELPPDLLRLLVTVFREMRAGLTLDGQTKVKTPSTVMSTAEAISVLLNGGLLAQHFGSGHVGSEEVARSLLGAVAKEDARDVTCLAEYLENVARPRKGREWQAFYRAGKDVL